MTRPAPIIFVHYGISDYMVYTLGAASRYNPDKEIILIGDEANRSLAGPGIRHVLFSDYLTHPLLPEFEKVYQRNGGFIFQQINEAKGGEDWTRFNFLKWFVLYAFAQSEKLENLWTFDTDTLIIEDLTQFEKSFKNFDYTVMNTNNQMQGFVRNTEAINDFCRLTIGMLGDEVYQKDLQKNEFTEHPDWGFTMMRVFKALGETNKYDYFQLRVEHNGYHFDECICQSYDEEITPFQVNGYQLKRVFGDGDGHLYNRIKSTKQEVRLFALNLSWVPVYVFKRLSEARELKAVGEIDLSPGLDYKVSHFAKRVKNKFRRMTGIKQRLY